MSCLILPKKNLASFYHPLQGFRCPRKTIRRHCTGLSSHGMNKRFVKLWILPWFWSTKTNTLVNPPFIVQISIGLFTATQIIIRVNPGGKFFFCLLRNTAVSLYQLPGFSKHRKNSLVPEVDWAFMLSSRDYVFMLIGNTTSAIHWVTFIPYYCSCIQKVCPIKHVEKVLIFVFINVA